MARPTQADLDRQVAMQTSRRWGDKPKVFQVVQTMALPHQKILDYGAGKFAEQAEILRDKGFDVTAYDHHGVEGVHDPKALDRRYDLVYASDRKSVV